MASISPPHHLSLLYTKRQFYPSSPGQQPQLQSRFFSLCKLIYSDSSTSTVCRCTNSTSSSSGSDDGRWDAALQSLLRDAMRQFDSFMNSLRNELNGSVGEKREIDGGEVGGDEGDWDWERWRRHFDEVDERDRLVSLLKSQLGQAVRREDYRDAARLKIAIAAAAANDTVGRVMSNFNRAVAEERYLDAALLRDNAGAGLVGWWSGIPEDAHDHYGIIIHITAEHGRYVARSYSPRQLATAAVGVPLFEIFVTINEKGEYKQQAVYLRRKGLLQGPSRVSSKASGATGRLNPAEDKNDLIIVSTDEPEDGDDTEDGSDLTEGLPGFQSILRDMIPGTMVKVLKVTATSKVDKDFISKVIEQIMDEEDEEKDIELEISEAEDEIKGESDQEKDEIEIDAGNEVIDKDEQSKISVEVVIGGLPLRRSGSVSVRETRVPAKLEKVGRQSFSFSIEKDINQQDSGTSKQTSADRKAKIQGQRSVDHVMFDLAKFIGKEKIPLKVLKDIGELINVTLSQTLNSEPMSGSTTFHRLDASTSIDPLNGLYIGAHGLYSSEVIQLHRRFGQWKDGRGTKELSDLQFYEYVEAVKVTGDPYVPAGQVAFRAKVGKRYQLPHKGIIPEEFGVIARYKGQGRLAEPGYRNPRWVDGELVILDGKYIKGGPVVGFIYWAPEYHFLVFFNRLRLKD